MVGMGLWVGLMTLNSNGRGAVLGLGASAGVNLWHSTCIWK